MRREELYVADLADNTRAIQEYLDGVSREQWDQDRLRRDAVLYRLLLLGEIASALPEVLPGCGLAADPGLPQSRGAQVLRGGLGRRMEDRPRRGASSSGAGHGHHARGVP